MLTLALKPGHDGSVAAIEDGQLLWCLEPEKDSFYRYSALTPSTILDLAENMGALPDVVALGGWSRTRELGHVGAGYLDATGVETHSSRFFGKEVKYFTSSHERSHLMMALGMDAPADDNLISVLVWEGVIGAFYVFDRHWELLRKIPVMENPGGRYAFLFALADPSFPDRGARPGREVSGKLMALAAFGDPADATPAIVAAVDQLLSVDLYNLSLKATFEGSVLHNAGVESHVVKTAAALLSRRIFDAFAAVALAQLPAGSPLRISGGCGLNCDWNSAWGDLGHFSSVFVPPCANDSGSAIGTAIDAAAYYGDRRQLNWSVYSGLEFVHDTSPSADRWIRRPLIERDLAATVVDGHVVAFVQGRWEMGPRALGHRSLLAEPYTSATKDRLNAIKRRESYRPIAPCCRVEDLSKAFVEDFHDPHMLYFRHVRANSLRAVTHVDGSARAQSVTEASNPRLHGVLDAFAAQTGLGVLCNTSLNFNGTGFINRMSDLVAYCEARGIDEMVIDGDWYSRRPE